MAKQTDIFIAFFRSGALGFGGGPATIPLVQKEVVETFSFITDDEFTDIIAIGNTLPGPIITKMAGYIGYRAGGVIGMLNAIIASVLPSALLMILLLVGLKEYKDIPFIKGMTNGVLPVVSVMMLMLIVEYVQKTKKAFGWLKAIVLIAIIFVFMIVVGVHPAIIIGAALILALSLPVKRGVNG